MPQIVDVKTTRWPATFVAMLVARSFGLAAGVALAILLAAALFSVQ
jgi:hypothetical protein